MEKSGNKEILMNTIIYFFLLNDYFYLNSIVMCTVKAIKVHWTGLNVI